LQKGAEGVAVDLRKIKKLIELVEESGIAELEVRDGDESIRIARPTGGAALVPAAMPVAQAAPWGEPAQEPAAAQPLPAATSQAPAAPSFPVRSPIAGTFYRAAEPGAAPFVEVGQAVEPGDVLCIIESMKMMNEITAEKAGVCTAVAVTNGQPVSSQDVLFRFA
jgi:acetyl-CoA carboxylase biotin carboxyl carrier protein